MQYQEFCVVIYNKTSSSEPDFEWLQMLLIFQIKLSKPVFYKDYSFSFLYNLSDEKKIYSSILPVIRKSH